MSHDSRKMSLGFLIKFNTNRIVQQKAMGRALKYRIYTVECLTIVDYLCSKTNEADYAAMHLYDEAQI